MRDNQIIDIDIPQDKFPPELKIYDNQVVGAGEINFHPSNVTDLLYTLTEIAIRGFVRRSCRVSICLPRSQGRSNMPWGTKRIFSRSQNLTLSLCSIGKMISVLEKTKVYSKILPERSLMHVQPLYSITDTFWIPKIWLISIVIIEASEMVEVPGEDSFIRSSLLGIFKGFLDGCFWQLIFTYRRLFVN